MLTTVCTNRVNLTAAVYPLACSPLFSFQIFVYTFNSPEISCLTSAFDLNIVKTLTRSTGRAASVLF